jgi:hypothetical protein
MSKAAMGAGLVAALVTTAAAARADCTKDTDCKGDRVCNAGACVAPTASSAATSSEAAPAPRQSTALFAGGLAMSIAGGAAVVVGGSMVVLSMNADSYNHAILLPGGAVTGIGGILCVAAGIPMAIIGGQRETPSRPATALAPWMTTHGGGLALGGSF